MTYYPQQPQSVSPYNTLSNTQYNALMQQSNPTNFTNWMLASSANSPVLRTADLSSILPQMNYSLQNAASNNAQSLTGTNSSAPPYYNSTPQYGSLMYSSYAPPPATYSPYNPYATSYPQATYPTGYSPTTPQYTGTTTSATGSQLGSIPGIPQESIPTDQFNAAMQQSDPVNLINQMLAGMQNSPMLMSTFQNNLLPSLDGALQSSDPSGSLANSAYSALGSASSYGSTSPPGYATGYGSTGYSPTYTDPSQVYGYGSYPGATPQGYGYGVMPSQGYGYGQPTSTAYYNPSQMYGYSTGSPQTMPYNPFSSGTTGFSQLI